MDMSPTHHGGFHIGFDREIDSSTPLLLEPATLLRHAMALGSSGSGKTVLSKVLVEEFVRHGVPAICIDPQGDLCSLALSDDSEEQAEQLRAKGIDPALARAFTERADPVVFTPASSKGIPLVADPVQTNLDDLNPTERMHAITGIATMLVSLLGYDLGSDDGEGLVAVFDQVLTDLLADEAFPANLEQFSEHLLDLDERQQARYGRYLDGRKLEQALRKLARLDVGARRLMFHGGHSVDIDMLLGLSGTGCSEDGKTRLAVIYLNTLHSQEDKEFFVAALAEQLYGWMLKNPAQEPQALFYIDEVAPYIPPVRKPACKPGLSLLFKQARKYGVACLMATQNPGDVDYKAMAQFGTWALGRLTTRQDLKKVAPTVKSLAPEHSDRIMDELPGQKPGEFLVISPDNFDGARRLQTRWLYTRHETLDEEAIAELTDERWRERFPLPSQTSEPPATKAPPAPVESEPSAEPEVEIEEQADQQATDPMAALREHSALLAQSPSMDTKTFARRAGVGEAAARKMLKRLVDADLAGQFKLGRSLHYWAYENGLRPDLGLNGPVKTIVPMVSAEQAAELAESQRKRAMLGLLGEEEVVEDIQLRYRLVLRIPFEEKIERPAWQVMLGRSRRETRMDSIYLHPRNLSFVVFNPKTGLRLEREPEGLASEIEDFDGVARFTEQLPDELNFDEQEWQDRPDDDEVLQRFNARFDADAGTIEPAFIPLWRVHLRSARKTARRIVRLDALTGQPMQW